MPTHPFDLLMELDARYIRLDCAALHLARDSWPDLAMQKYLHLLDQMADDVAAQRPGLSANLRYEAMRQVLVEGYGLTGNEYDYYDPENSYLNRVLDRRIGAPITLSLAWIEVGRRLKWPVSGLNLPGYFIVRFDDIDQFVLADPFRHGRTLSLDDCRSVLDQQFDGAVEFSSSFLKPAGTSAILRRLLSDLRYLYTVNHDWTQLGHILARLAALDPDDAAYMHELAGLLYRQGDVQRSREQLEAFIEDHPAALDDFLTREKLTHLGAILASLN